MSVLNKRLTRELEMMEQAPPPGISCWCVNDDMTNLRATIIILDDSSYQKGMFHLSVKITLRYPFEPPLMKFITPIYHPNIDKEGVICLDLLKMPPMGNWKPSLNISSLLQSIQILVTEPNLDDPLVADIATEFRTNKQKFLSTAKSWTLKYASEDQEIQKVASKRKSENKEDKENQMLYAKKQRDDDE